MKIFVLYFTTDQPFGGTNQFTRALKRSFEEQGVLTRHIGKADVVLLNNHSLGGSYGSVFRLGYALKMMFPHKIFVHRVDGPVQLYGDANRAKVDQDIYQLNATVADGTIFQSQWSREQNRVLGMLINQYEVVISNAADPVFFFPPSLRKSSDRIRLIATSWSHHPNKGFDIYDELDRRLDWSKFDMTFVGRTPQRWRNITRHEPVSSRSLGELLRSHDIYITASKNDPCSNALIEALTCGLPAVARNSGGHPELIGMGGRLFNNASEAIEGIEEVARERAKYRDRIAVTSMADVARDYVEFCQRIMNDRNSSRYRLKRVSFSAVIRRIFLENNPVTLRESSHRNHSRE